MGQSPSRLKALTISIDGGEEDLVQAKRFLDELGMGFFLEIVDVATIFLTNRECPFHCLMCDLRKNTTDIPVPPGAIPVQIEWALKRLPEVNHLKLYNSSSYFGRNAIPEEDYKSIASLVAGFNTVIVENHPRLITENNTGD